MVRLLGVIFILWLVATAAVFADDRGFSKTRCDYDAEPQIPARRDSGPN